MEAASLMPRLLNMAVRTVAKNFLALFLLFAVCAPYVHGAIEIIRHEECGMESCKRAGKCCCRRTNPGKPHWNSQDICHTGGAQLAGISAPVAAVLGQTHRVEGLTRMAELFVPATAAVPVHPIAIVRFQRPPPPLF